MVKKNILSEVHKVLEEKFFHPEFNFFIDVPIPFESEEFPTQEEIKKGIPAPTGWISGIEDGAINGGINLEGQVLGYEITKDKKYLEMGRKVLNGLLKLSTCGHPGFISRSVWSDGKIHYPFSSIDQYTMAVYGLWRAFFSEIPTQEQKKKIKEVLGNVAEKFYREKGDILSDDGRYEKEFTGGGPRDTFPGVERTLEMFKAAYSVTKEEKFNKYYKEWIEDKNFPSVSELMRKYEISSLTWSYNLFQTQIALRLLWETEKNSKMKEAYQKTMKRIAIYDIEILKRYDYHSKRALSFPDDLGWRKFFEYFGGWKTHKELVGLVYYWWFCHPGRVHECFTIKDPLEAAYVILLSEDREIIESQKERIKKLLETFPYKFCKLCHSLAYYEGAFFWAIKKGVI